MEPFVKLTDSCVGVPRSDIDTDIIIPAAFLTVTTRQGLGQHVFSRVRKEDAAEFTNVDRYPDRSILIARDNFGCGSSREHAVWALMDWGYKVVIAPSFANIFHNNALKNGLLPIAMPEVMVEHILSQCDNAEYKLTVDLEAQTVTFPDMSVFEFVIDPYSKTCLLQGMGDFEYLASNLEAIKQYDEARKKHLFFDIHNIPA